MPDGRDEIRQLCAQRFVTLHVEFPTLNARTAVLCHQPVDLSLL